jgi:CheY-like chemotaxis protein
MSHGHILFVEDDVDVADTLRIYFMLKEYEVTIATTGGEGLEQCRRKLPHVIVLDIMLPDMDGYEVCQRLRSHRKMSGRTRSPACRWGLTTMSPSLLTWKNCACESTALSNAPRAIA